MEISPDPFVRDDPRWPIKFETPYKENSRGHVQPERVSVETIDWCRDQFGDDPERWRFSAHHIAFRDEIDAVAFRMRWG